MVPETQFEYSGQLKALLSPHEQHCLRWPCTIPQVEEVLLRVSSIAGRWKGARNTWHENPVSLPVAVIPGGTKHP